MIIQIKKGFLWAIFLLEIAVLIVVFLLYLLSDPKTLKYAVDRATSGLEVSYDSISGNFLKTMTVQNLRYKNKLLASQAEIDWNLRALLQGKIEIESLLLKKVNLSNIKNIIQHIQSTKKQKTKNKKLYIPQITISHLYLSTLPFKDKWIKLHSLELEVRDVSTNLEHIKIKDFSLKTTNDYANIIASGEIKNDILHLTHLKIEALNIQRCIDLTHTLQKRPKTKQGTFTLFKAVDIDTLFLGVKPYHDSKYQLNHLSLQAKILKTNLDPLLMDAQTVKLQSDTNILSLILQGNIQKNHFQGDARINLVQKYFQHFTKIVDFKSLNPIHLTHLQINPKTVKSDVVLQSKQIFAGRYKDYPVAIKKLKSTLSYELNSSLLRAHTDANISTKYASSLHLVDTLTFDGNLSYGGSIAINGLQKFPAFSVPLFKDAKIEYKGDSHDLVADLHCDKLHLNYKMFDYQKADFILTSKELNISRYFPQIPNFLYPLKAKTSAHMHLDFKHPLPLIIENNISSNLLELEGKTTIKKGEVLTKTKSTLVKNSFIKKAYPNVKWQKIFPGDLAFGYHDRKIDVVFNAKKSLFKNHFSYDTNQSILSDTFMIDADKITVEGTSDNLHIVSHTYSLKTLQESLQKLYHFRYEPYDGEVDINATLKAFNTLDANIYSRWLVYEYKPNTFAFAEKIKMQLQLTPEEVRINHYYFSTYLDYDRIFYANKPSVMRFSKQKLTLQSLWINDALNTTGGYNIEKKQGAFHSKADNYHYKGEEGDITFDTNIKTTLSQNRTHIEGAVHVKKGLITYEHRKTHDIQDPDIIILQEQEQRRREKEEKKNNLSIDITVDSKRPLTYKVPKVEVSITPDIKIWKEAQKDVELLGRLIVHKGTYTEGQKEFNILPGEVLFGGEMLNPYLALRAKYTNNPYVINIDVTGTLDAPIINFSSSPYLSQSDILSMLLFSSTTDSLFEGKSSSSNQAISMLGNTFAKEIVKNFGLTLDKLVISTNEEGGLGIEIGKKISKKITVIYINDIVQSIKVRYQHSDRFETDLMLSPESSGIDFIYKSEH